MRDLMLEDGSRIALNGGTAMRFDPRTPRTIVLERGEALFSVAHDARRPFEVRVGDAVVRDVGTVFDVAADRGRIEVGVREGAVEFVRAGTTVALAAGDTLRSAGPDAAVVAKTDPGGIGGWRTGRLAYTQATMSDVAHDLTRVTGTPFAIDPDVADRRFSGVISVAGDGPTVARRVEAVTGLALSRSAQGWRITSPHR
jgi:transmembrane sensor